MGFSFSEHIELVEEFLARRQEIVDNLERRLFGERGKAMARTGDRESVANIFTSCFFESASLPRHLCQLKGQLLASHLADGFEPGAQDGYSRQLDAVELVLRASHHWDHDRWPGRNGRIAYAQSLYGVYILGLLEHLSLRIWDDVNDSAAERLRHIQRLLDSLNVSHGHPSLGALLVRDARWLIQTAQGPLTRHVKPYFITAGKVSKSLTDGDRLEIHMAGAKLAG